MNIKKFMTTYPAPRKTLEQPGVDGQFMMLGPAEGS